MHKVAISCHNQKLPIYKLLTHSIALVLMFLTVTSWAQDSTVNVTVEPKTNSGINTIINYSAEDSILFDVISNGATLYGNSHVDYGKIILDAEIIHINWGTKMMSATYGIDSAGKKFGIPVFNDKGDIYHIDTMAYNWETKKAYIADVLTNQNNGWLLVDEAYKDENDILYAENSAFCPCQDSSAGTYIKSKQIKVIPNKRVYTGPFQLYVGHIPTPIVGPFGMFPATSKKSSGLIIPSYGEDKFRGFFLKKGGFYWAMNDYVGIKFLGEIYTEGGWGLEMITKYKNRYHYNGGINLSFRKVIRNGDEFNQNSQNDYSIRWQHAPETKGNKRFTANVNFATTSFNSNNERQTDNYLASTLQSSIKYYQPIKGTPFNYSINLRHDQNNQTGVVNFTLPDANFSMVRQYPFKGKSSKKRSKARKALETINFSYTLNSKNRITTKEPTYNFGFDIENYNDLDTGEVAFNGQNITTLLKRSNFGIQHNIPVSGSIKLGPFNLNGNANYKEIWTPKIFDFERATDTSVNVIQQQGFNRAYSYSAGMNLTTRIYGHFAFKGDRKRQIRHVIAPNIGYGFSPDYTNLERFSYKTLVELADSSQYTVSKYENAIFSPPSSGLSSSISFSLRNTLEMKFIPKSDTINKFKYVSILDNLSIGSRYNFAADSMNLSDITFSANTKLFNLINLRLSGILNPYSTVDNDGIASDISVYRWKNKDGFAYLTNLNFNAGAKIGPHTFNKNKTKKSYSAPRFDHDLQWYLRNNPDLLWFDPTIPWSMDIRYTVNVNRFEYTENDLIQSLRFSGSFKLSQLWAFQYSTSYDFVDQDFIYPRMSVYRDLGCWEMTMGWTPFGITSGYDFNINIKSAMLKDIIKYNLKDTYYNRQ